MEQQHMTGKQRRSLSLRWKLLIGFTLVFSIVFAAAYYWFYNFATDMALRRIREDLVTTLQATAAGVDGDQLQALTKDGLDLSAKGVIPQEGNYPDDARYWEQVKWLATVAKIEPRAGLYTYVTGDKPGELVLITSSGAAENPPFGVKYMERWVTDNPGPNLQGLKATALQNDTEAFTTNWQSWVAFALAAPVWMSSDIKPYTDDWGTWVSGFTPVKNSKGEVVAGLGCDFRADYVSQVQEAILSKVLVAFAITYLALFALVFLVSRVLTRPIIALTTVAGVIAEGDYEGGLSRLKSRAAPRFPDEIHILAEVFDLMVNKVYQREQMLRRQVAELKIEIDEVKRQKQVSEIVDSDFFQDLRAKARSMRERKASSGEGPA